MGLLCWPIHSHSPLWLWAFWQMCDTLMKWCDWCLNAKTHGREFFFVPHLQHEFRVTQTWQQNSALPLWIVKFYTSYLSSSSASVKLRTTVSAQGRYCEGFDMKGEQYCLAQGPASKSCPISVSWILGFPLDFFFFSFKFVFVLI